MMKNLTKILSLTVLVIALAVFSTACQRLSQASGEETERDEDSIQTGAKEPGETDQKEPEEKEQHAYLVPFALNSGYSLLYGYADKSGKTVIEPKFKGAEPSYDCGAAVVTEFNEKSGLIDEKGDYIIQPEYNYLFYSGGLFLAYKEEGNLTTAFDENGNKQFERSGYIYEFNDGLSPYYSETEKGYINTKGELVLSLDFENLGPFKNGVALVSEVYFGASFYIDTNGNDVTGKVSSGLWMYKDDTSSLFGYKNKSGDITIPAQFEEAEPFFNGYAVVKESDPNNPTSYGMIDTQGNYVLEPKYCGIVRMQNGLVSVGEEVKDDYMPFGYFDYSKKALYTADMTEHTDWVYYTVDDFDEKRVCVNDEDSVFFIGNDLKPASDLPVFKGRGYFKKDGELLRGDFNNLLTVADLKGRILTSSSEKIDLGGGLTAEMQMVFPNRTTTLAYPVLSGIEDKVLTDKINKLIMDEMVTPYDIPSVSDDPYALTVVDTDIAVMRQKDLLLLDQSIYEYSLGAAHPAHFRNTLFIDLKTGVKYTLTDLFKPSGEAFPLLSEIVSNQMKVKMEEVGYWEDHVTITPENPFALAEGGIVLYFGEYEIASYAAGMQEFFIPFKDLEGVLETEGPFWKSFNQ